MPVSPTKPAYVFFDWHGTLVHYAPGKTEAAPLCAPQAKALTTLHTLTAHNIAMGIVSNEHSQVIHCHLKQLGWATLFQAIVSADSTPFLKPDPRPLQHAMQQLGKITHTKVLPHQTWFVGDTPNDVICADRAGVWPIFLTHLSKGPAPCTTVPYLHHLPALLSLH